MLKLYKNLKHPYFIVMNLFQSLYTQGSAPAPSPSSCETEAWKGDSYCDDGNNNKGCDYDGGDCCGDNVKTNYCSACECKDPDMAPCEK